MKSWTPKGGNTMYTKEQEESIFVGVTMMCYTAAKAVKVCLGERQLRGRMGKLL